MIRIVVAGLLTLFCMPAKAQAPAPVRALCDNQLKPAYEKLDDYSKANLTADCGCIVGYLTGRYGAEDAEAILRLFAAFTTESEERIKAAFLELGETKFRALTAKIGNFQSVGRELDQSCPPIKKP